MCGCHQLCHRLVAPQSLLIRVFQKDQTFHLAVHVQYLHLTHLSSVNSSRKLLLLHVVIRVCTPCWPISAHNIEHCVAFYILEDYQNFLLYVGQGTGDQDTSVAVFYVGSISRSDVCVRKCSENSKYFTGEEWNYIFISLFTLFALFNKLGVLFGLAQSGRSK